MFLIFFFTFVAFLNGQTPTTMPPSPAPAYCNSIGGWDIGPAVGPVDRYLWVKNDSNSYVSYSLCSTINSNCGETGAACAAVSTGCCGMCQGWGEADGQVSTCLGKFTMARVVSGFVQLQYDGGDQVQNQNIGRRGLLNIHCGAGGSAGNPSVMPTLFTQAQGHEPNEPYVYVLEVTSPLVCGGIGGGAWILIIMFCFLLPGYVVGGFLANKFHFMKEHEGGIMEFFPNYEFWCDTPSLFLDGVQFTKSKFMALIGREEY